MAFDREPDLDGEVAGARDEALCPVNRVNHPRARAAQAARGVHGLLGQHAVAGESFAQTPHDQLVGGAVSLRHRLVELGLVLDVQRPAVEAEHRRPRLARQPDRDAQLLFVNTLRQLVL